MAIVTPPGRLIICMLLPGLLATGLPTRAAAQAITAQADSAEIVGDKPAPWEVAAPSYSVSAKTVPLAVTEGTWMSLDVSPDGGHSVFDLLGDLYEIPITGGPARVVSEGHAWDMQPRYSPDGSSVAFVSDRAGGDNLWVMELSTGAARQITDESFRLLTNPTWRPDGRYLAARKHFTTSRSLGTGELWMYYAGALGRTRENGLEGVPVVERASVTFQKELGEPTFSADGQWLYFTQNVTPGDTFVYHQDTNNEVFRIKRVHLARGEVADVAGGPGGAVRPTPSPNGRYLAFVRRIEGESSLILRTLTSGVERVLVRGLDPDMQETWAVHGLYPNMSWTPDSASVVFWAGGKIKRVDVATGQVAVIPFTVDHTRSVYPGPRPVVAVAPETFRTKMVRFANASEPGGTVVFESLGALYTKAASAPPVALLNAPRTAQGEGLQSYPVWQADGKRIYYVHWSDRDLGSVRSVSRRGRQPQVHTPEPGHYVEPAVSPDGRWLLYRKTAGDVLKGPNFGERPGIYLVDLRNGDSRFLTRRGIAAHFGNGQIYFTERKQASGRGSETAQSKLYSMNLRGEQIREVAHAQLATQFLVAPDGAHVVFRESYELYVSPLPTTGKSLALGPGQKNLPVFRITTQGGNYPAWSVDGTTVSWSLGAEFFTLPVAALWQPQSSPGNTDAAQSGTSPELAPASDDLSQVVTTDVPVGTLVLDNVRVITMNARREVLEGARIVVKNNRIEQVGVDIEIPSQAQVVDLEGQTVMPGLIDAHAHGSYASGEIIPEHNWNSLAHLALGVTTQHNPSSPATQVFAAAEYARAGRILSSRLFSTGNIVYGAKAQQFAPVDSLDDALAHVRRLKAQGAISIKNYNQPRREQRQMVIEAARQEELLVLAEGGSLYHMDMNLVVDGSTGIEHNLPALKTYADVTQIWRHSNAGYTPTLVVTYGGLTAEDYYYQKHDVWQHPLLAHFVPPSVLQPRSVRRVMAPERDYRDDDAAAVARELMKAGVLVNIGAHGQREGLASHWEMWSFVRGGMSPMEALATATINPAMHLGMQNDLGSIERGKLADLVVLTANPLNNIEHSDKLSYVILNGRMYVAENLQEVFTGTAPAPLLWWHTQEDE